MCGTYLPNGDCNTCNTVLRMTLDSDGSSFPLMFSGGLSRVSVCVRQMLKWKPGVIGCQAASCSSQEFEREKHAHSVLQFQFNEMKETLKQSEELLNVSICPPVWNCVRLWEAVQKRSLLWSQKPDMKKTAVTSKGCMLHRTAFFSFHTLYVCMHHIYLVLSLRLKLHFLFLLFRRSVSCVWSRRVLLEKFLTCRRRWSGRIKKLRYGLWALVQQFCVLLTWSHSFVFAGLNSVSPLHATECQLLLSLLFTSLSSTLCHLGVLLRP